MKKLAAKLFIALAVLGGIPNLVLANTNSSTDTVTVANLTAKTNILAGVNFQNRYSLRIRNNTRWEISRIYMSTAETDNWGPDQLGDNVLRSGGSYTMTGIRPAEYDIRFIDEDNDQCVLRNIQIFENTYWTLTSDWLVRCEKGR